MRGAKYVSFTAKGLRVLQLLQMGNHSIDEAIAVADREFTADGLSPRTEFEDVLEVLSSGPGRMGEVTF